MSSNLASGYSEHGTLLDPHAVYRTIQTICGKNITEIRVLGVTSYNSEWEHTQSGYFNDSDKLVRALESICTAKGIYFIPNAVDPALLGRASNRLRKTPKGESTSDANIIRRRWLLIDCDAVRPSGISATDEEHEAALAMARDIDIWLHNLGWSTPIYADSGNGGHLLYRIDLPADDNGLVQRCLEAIAAKFDYNQVKVDTSVINPARIWKLYGTLACKGDNTRERPHRMAKLLNVPENIEVVPVELLEQLTGSQQQTQSRQITATASISDFSLEEFIHKHRLDVSSPKPWSKGPQLWVLNKSPLCCHGGDGPFIAVDNEGRISAGCHHNSCSWDWRKLRQHLEPGCYDRAVNVGNERPQLNNSTKSDNTPWQPSVVSLDSIEALQTEWLWPDYLPTGAIVVIDGDPGLGKSQITIDLAARLSRGDAMPPDTAPDGTYESKGTLILNAEDDPGRTLKPRLEAALAEMSRIHLLREMANSDGENHRPLTLPRDLPEMVNVIQANDIGLVVIDPFVAFLDSNININNDADVRQCLGQVAVMAERTGVCVLLVRHLNKKQGLGAIYRGGGSIGITGAARSVFLVGEDPTDKESRILAPVKCNLAPSPPSLRFSIESIGQTSRVKWLDSCDIAAADLLGKDKSGQGTKLELAKNIITDILSCGPRGSNEVERACKDAGISVATIKRARKELGVEVEKTGFGDGQWMLTLPSQNGVAPC